MLTDPPREREWVSWLGLFAWMGVVFATIPLARGIQFWVQNHMGREAFGWFVIAVIAATASGCLWKLRRQRLGSPAQIAWLIAVSATFVAYTVSLWKAPEEAFHFVQYGVLGVLAFRALSHRTRDPGIYVAAALLGISAGVVDEAIQWLTPDRFWGLRDIWINAVASVLTQLGIAKGIAPPFVQRGLSRRSVRLSARLSGLALLLLGASLLNTPERIAAYSARFESLAFLASSESVMFEYGELIDDPETGRFRSRLTLEDLGRSDEVRGEEAAKILDRYPDTRYGEFLKTYTPVGDPFVHEARVHLFRRDRNRRLARDHPEDRRRHHSIAFRENRILELYFPKTLQRSKTVLDRRQRAQLERDLLPDFEYESPVSASLVTSVGEREIAIALGLALFAVVWVDRTLGRDR